MKEQLKKAAEIAERLGFGNVYGINIVDNSIIINATFSDDLIPRIVELGFMDETREEDEFLFFSLGNVTLAVTD
jgi:hypothetical protein